ncbi:hypothetical protein SLEP1_g57895 [Rubroshorea leprosula]|uniref:RNA-directed DNA polymerase n=1 Tax=Rubroshorea leprosula TaxID=152421 RepID=A0AAV5MMS5_9ROSI|nr:hypothetical protein SLEP1_g57895 [Rubroshorea leprosula]
MVHTRSVRAGNSSLPHGQGQPPNNLPPPIPPQILPQLPPQVPTIFPPVDHAEGGDENQPHTSAHNSTSIANQDVVTAQLAAMQQQFGVFQLVLAQLLARNNPGDPLINLLNPAQQPPAPQQNPQPVQPAPAISESQGQSHIAPAQQPIPDDVTRRLDSLEKLVAEHRGAPPPHHAADSIPHPLNTNITLEPYPVGFKIPQLETYDRTKDPDDHLHAFYSCMQAQNASDALMCKIFPSTLRGNARTWYYSLPPRSISSYTEMASAFATKFSSRRLIRKTTTELMRVKQREGESLKNYMSRFNDAVLEVSSFDQAVGIAAVISGLKHDRFRDSLIKHAATTFSEVNDRSLKFITAEEYALAQNPPSSKNQNPEWRDDNLSRKRMRMAQNRGPMLTSPTRFGRTNSTPPQQSAGKPPVSWTPFNLPTSQIFMQIKNKMDLRRPGPMKTAAASRDHTRYCDFHQDHGHTTEQCNSLKSELESLAQKGMLNEQGLGYQQAPPLLPPPARIIHMITRGLEAGGLSSKQRKLYVRERVFVDTGSAPDIMYFHCFESLGLDPALLQKYDGPIYGFNNQPIPVEGVLTLHVAFGSGRTYVTPSVRFLVVKMASSFNIVIGRPTLTEIRAMVSQSHLCMKFPTPMGIATLRGNQEVARHCYITSVTQPMKGKAQTPEAIPQQIPDNQQVMGVEIVDNRPEDETRAAPVEDVEEVLIDDRDLSRKTQIGTRLNPEERAELIAFLRANNDANGKWRMCIDYTNLNHACPKDCYPMPSIDKLVEAASGNERLSLLDAYSGYHQVLMAPEDEEKTAFYAGDEIYCYVMMPFGLKNAGATYKKMVTIVFHAQIGKNLEVYVNDIVVKSLKAEDHLADLDETFNNLRKNKMRLNPAKCIFGVESGKFLGFMVSRRGIEVNPEKIRVIAEMEPPKSVKDIQRLTGRVAALHRFISKSANKYGELLYLYLGISDEAISSVLVREEARQQKPIYYISSVLHGAELRYLIAEKAALAVVTSARKLRSYFQSHPIIVLTDQPLRQILQKPECSGRLIKWAVELEEFEITFQQRSAIRAQALTDFIVECTPCPSTSNPEPNDWTLYVDGASSSKGSGAGTLLIGPEGYRSEHGLKFNFDATNNMAEYEALLLGLQLALELKISAIQVYSDSQLVVNQINSICEVVDPVMVKYVTLVAELKCKFQKFCLSKIPRAENEQADLLSKFASDSSLSPRSVFVEILDEPSFMKPRMMEISTNSDTPSWTDSIISFLRDGIVPEDRQKAMKLRKKASRYTLVDGVFYKRSFSLPLLRCLNPYEAEYALREDAAHFVQKCPRCQFFAHLTHQPAEELTNLVAPWPFAQWGLDLLGPFVKGVGGVIHLVVGVDYFTKWVEARPLSSLTSKKVEDFVFSSIICRYGIPNQIVADNGTQFNCSSFRDFCSSYGIKLQFTSVYHPESNGMVESVNKCILEGETPYHLAFGTEAVIPVEIGVPSFWVTHFDEGRNGQLLRENLDLLAEVREEARLRTLVYKQKLANFYNKRVRPRTFKVGDLVLKKAGLTGFETRFGKLAPNWKGPYAVAELPHPGAYVLQDAEGKRVPRVWNVNNLKKFYP